MIHQPYTTIRTLIWNNSITTFPEIILRISLDQLCKDASIAPSQVREWLHNISNITLQEVKQLAEMLGVPEYRMMRIVIATEKMQQAQRN
ncbi:helix-turn-helix transcriptional regulator [Chitinophaga sp. YIM B06452]|uniref:helix-turn-helix domain-containing protein n=1 Tax=Chitinophaga sp. YIM B06452 TaxID=3082158 RepID=UPI0031FE8D5B